MTVTLKKVGVSIALIDQTIDKSLIVPPSASIYENDKSTLAAIYSDESGTALANPVPVNVAIGDPGVDSGANLNIWCDPGFTGYVLVNGEYVRLSTVPTHGADSSTHINSTSDPHGAQAAAQSYADSTFLPKTTDITGLAGAAAQAYLDANLGLD